MQKYNTICLPRKLPDSPLSNSFFSASTNANKLRNTDSIPVKKGIDIIFSVINSEYVDSGRCALYQFMNTKRNDSDIY